MARINTTIPDEMKAWLDKQPHLTASGLLQRAIQAQYQREHAVKNIEMCPNCEREFGKEAAAEPYVDDKDVDWQCSVCGEPLPEYQPELNPLE